MTKQSTNTRKKAASEDPFLFLGHGFGTSERNLECYLWFARAPGERARKRIEGLLPFPVAAFVRFEEELLHFGSDDDVGARVCAAYHPDYAERHPDEALEDAMAESVEPRAREWKAFNAELEHAVSSIHAGNELVAAIKPDDGTYGRKPSAWHRRSVARATELAERARRRQGAVGAVASSLWMNVLEDVLPDAAAAKKLDSAARGAWLAWLPVLVRKGRRELRETFAERLGWVLGAMKPRERDEALAGLVPPTRRAVEAVATFDAPATTVSRKTGKPAARSKKPAVAKAERSGDKMLRAALEDIVVPRLLQAGFEGRFPKFRRIGQRTQVLWFRLERGAYAHVQVGVSVMAKRPGASLADDYNRAFETRNQKEWLTSMVTGEPRMLLWYENAAEKWGNAWPRALAEHVLELIETRAEPWLARRSGKKA
jgi:hypothetical protein